MPRLTPSNNYGSGEDDVLSAAAPPPPPTPPSPVLPLLRYLIIDDARLLTWLLTEDSHRGQNGNEDTGRFFRHHLLTSLRRLDICRSELTALTVDEEEGLRALASSLQCLSFQHCPNLQNLPADLRGLLPNLQTLRIENCPKLLERLRPPPRATPPSMRGAEEDDWHKVAHIPVIEIDGVYPQGSFSKYLELKAKWDFIF